MLFVVNSQLGDALDSVIRATKTYCVKPLSVANTSSSSYTLSINARNTTTQLKQNGTDCMKLYYHHVGREGAERDFPRTVFARNTIELVERTLPQDIEDYAQVVAQLHKLFPDGTFNCWGVPEGAQFVIKHLTPGDVVLLVKTAGEYGEIPAMAQVKAFWPHQLRTLSAVLWESSHYPYVFFFDTEELDLSWPQFLEHMGYGGKYNPRGNFLSVADKRLRNLPYSSSNGYVDYLRAHHVTDHRRSATSWPERSIVSYQSPDKIVHNTVKIGDNTVEYTEGATKQVLVNAYERNTQARVECIRHHGLDCVICGFNFGTQYGPAGDGFVHVHHIVPLSQVGENYVVNPIKDLVPVCANCHAILHRRNPPYTIDEVKAMLDSTR